MTDLTIPGKNWPSFRESMIAKLERQHHGLFATEKRERLKGIYKDSRFKITAKYA